MESPRSQDCLTLRRYVDTSHWQLTFCITKQVYNTYIPLSLQKYKRLSGQTTFCNLASILGLLLRLIKLYKKVDLPKRRENFELEIRSLRHPFLSPFVCSPLFVELPLWNWTTPFWALFSLAFSTQLRRHGEGCFYCASPSPRPRMFTTDSPFPARRRKQSVLEERG